MQPIRAALHASAKVVFVHTTKGAPQLARSRRLGGREFARGIAHLLGEARKFVAQLLAIVHHFVDVLGGRVGQRLAGAARGTLLSQQPTHAIGLLLLLGRQSIGRFGHRVEPAGVVLLLNAAQQIGGLAQAVGGAAGIGRSGIARHCAPHIVVSLSQSVERLLGCLLAAVGGLLRGLPGTGA
jgi:hypothetical protein